MTPPTWDADGLPTPPPVPPRPGREPLRASRVWAGIGSAMLAHLVAAACPAGALIVASSETGKALIFGGLVAEIALFLAAVIGGIVLIVRGDRAFGIGLIIGWAVGFIVLPLIGMGVCVSQMMKMES